MATWQSVSDDVVEDVRGEVARVLLAPSTHPASPTPRTPARDPSRNRLQARVDWSAGSTKSESGWPSSSPARQQQRRARPQLEFWSTSPAVAAAPSPYTGTTLGADECGPDGGPIALRDRLAAAAAACTPSAESSSSSERTAAERSRTLAPAAPPAPQPPPASARALPPTAPVAAAPAERPPPAPRLLPPASARPLPPTAPDAATPAERPPPAPPIAALRAPPAAAPPARASRTPRRLGSRCGTPPPGCSTYDAVAGDTLAAIALRSGVSLGALRAANRLPAVGGLVYPGQRLWVPLNPRAAQSATAAPPAPGRAAASGAAGAAGAGALAARDVARAASPGASPRARTPQARRVVCGGSGASGSAAESPLVPRRESAPPLPQPSAPSLPLRLAATYLSQERGVDGTLTVGVARTTFEPAKADPLVLAYGELPFQIAIENARIAFARARPRTKANATLFGRAGAAPASARAGGRAPSEKLGRVRGASLHLALSSAPGAGALVGSAAQRLGEVHFLVRDLPTAEKACRALRQTAALHNAKASAAAFAAADAATHAGAADAAVPAGDEAASSPPHARARGLEVCVSISADLSPSRRAALASYLGGNVTVAVRGVDDADCAREPRLPPSKLAAALLAPFKPRIRGRTPRSPAALLSSADVEYLAAYLPPRQRLCDWQLLYGLEEHGCSLHTFYARVSGYDATVLVVKDVESGSTFGAFAPSEWHVARGFYGTGEALLFSLRPARAVRRWSGRNSYNMLSDESSIALGAGGNAFGLWLGADFAHGSSGPCETFEGDGSLAPSSEFKVAAIEVYGLVTPSLLDDDDDDDDDADADADADADD